MAYHTSWSRKCFVFLNGSILILISALCLFPLVHVLAISFSSSSAASAGLVKFWPVNFTVKSYTYMLENPDFIKSFVVSVNRVVWGGSLSVFLSVITAYPLSKNNRALSGRTFYAWFFVFTILFNGGLIPWYMTIKNVGIMGTMWALILPSAVTVFNIILLLNFFRGLPKELEESAFMDGAGYWSAMWRLIVPLSFPALATISLFTLVFHWNSWFDGMILMNSPEKYPLSTYLQTVLITTQLTELRTEELRLFAEISDRTTKAAQIFLGTLPILLIYPFLQRFFTKGIVLGSVKE